MKVIENMEQGTQEWHEARRMKITGTKLKSVMGTAQAQFDLIAELIAEEGTEQSKAFRATAEMERGSQEEIFAIKLFEKTTGKKVTQVGICQSEEFDFVSLSPDGLIIDADGKYSEAVEIKAPNSATLIKYKMANLIDEKETKLTPAKKPFLGIPADYKWQVVHNFIVNKDLRKLYFVAYDERFIDKGQKLYIVETDWKNEVLQEAVFDAEKALKEFREKWLRWRDIILPSNF
ncbi:MAG TPA: hypothetical protein ENI63_02020 [Candidatus Kaiserbacteria bacterium]|nr:hypothetical protein [Candidatus Kaiserbacteria bacterium]